MTKDHLVWYTARSAGLVAWTLLAAGTMWGLALSGGVVRRRVRNAWMLDLHRYLGALAVVFVGVHVGALLLDGFVGFDVGDVLIPFASNWSPVAVAFGVVSLYLLVAVEVTSLLRSWMPRGWWKRVHYASFPLFAFATIHGVAAGTDTGSRVAIGTVVATSGLIGGLTWWRVHRSRDSGRRPPRGAVPVPARVRSAAASRPAP